MSKYYNRKARIQQAQKMQDAGASRQEIADELSVMPNTVSQYLKQAFRPRLTNEMLIEMYRVYRDVGNWAEVARRLDTTPQSITYWRKLAKQRGIQ